MNVEGKRNTGSLKYDLSKITSVVLNSGEVDRCQSVKPHLLNIAGVPWLRILRNFSIYANKERMCCLNRRKKLT